VTGTGGATLLSPTSDPETAFGFDGHKASLTGGGFVGYNYQFGRMVVGAEADFAAKKTESAANATVMTNAFYGNTNTPGQTDTASRTEFFTGQVRQNWDASARLRVGGLLTPSILLYGTGGVAFGSVDSAFSFSATSVYNEIGGGSVTHTTSFSRNKEFLSSGCSARASCCRRPSRTGGTSWRAPPGRPRQSAQPYARLRWDIAGPRGRTGDP